MSNSFFVSRVICATSTFSTNVNFFPSDSKISVEMRRSLSHNLHEGDQIPAVPFLNGKLQLSVERSIEGQTFNGSSDEVIDLFLSIDGMSSEFLGQVNDEGRGG